MVGKSSPFPGSIQGPEEEDDPSHRLKCDTPPPEWELYRNLGSHMGTIENESDRVPGSYIRNFRLAYGNLLNPKGWADCSWLSFPFWPPLNPCASAVGFAQVSARR